MSRIPLSPPPIKPLPVGISRPTWSVMIPIYNGSKYLKEAIESVLVQDPGAEEMQIEVVDDCSTDADVRKIVDEVGKGRVNYFRQQENCGSVRNFETCINRAKGHYIHLLHCDDKVRPGFYASIGKLFEQFPQAAAAFCVHEIINADGDPIGRRKAEAEIPCILENLLVTLAKNNPIQYVSMVVKREIYERLGSFYGVEYGEDWEMWARIAKDYPIAYTPEPLALYRDHLNSISVKSFIAGKNLDDMIKVLSVISTYLPEADRKRLSRVARKEYVSYSLSYTEKLFRKSQFPTLPYAHLKQTLSFYNDFHITTRVARFLLVIWLKPIKRYYRKLTRK